MGGEGAGGSVDSRGVTSLATHGPRSEFLFYKVDFFNILHSYQVIVSYFLNVRQQL